MKKTFFKKVLSLALSAMLLSLTLLSAVSCAPPELWEVKDTYVSLIEESAEVNRILFGQGLSVYGEMSYDEESGIYYHVFYTKEHGKLCAYYDKTTGKYLTLRFGDKGETGAVYSDDEAEIYLYPSDFEYIDFNKDLPDAFLPMDYSFVRLDEVAVSVKDISDMAAKVYSEDYLADVFETLMGGLDDGDVIIDETFVPRYKEITDGEKKYLVKASQRISPPITEEVRIYDFDSMAIGDNSNSSFVNIDINSYGTYVDMDAGEIKVGWSTVTLSFVLQNGEWRLDSPTY